MSFLGYKDVIEDGDTVIVFLGHESMMPLKMVLGNTTQTRYGALRHSELIGKRYGSKVSTLGGKGWVYVLHPTPELWTVNLPHRTQVLYFPDISLLTFELELKPGSIVVEAGTGSGSVSHSIARTIAPSGHLYTFEFHEQRAEKASEEFVEHNLSDIVTVTHRDVSTDGFLLDVDYKADAIFLDLPSPWNVIPHAKKVLKTRGGRICSFSPCIEQVQRACVELDALGFTDIKTVECLIRNYDVKTINLPLPNIGEPRNLEGDSKRSHTGSGEPAEKRARTEDNGTKAPKVDSGSDDTSEGSKEVRRKGKGQVEDAGKESNYTRKCAVPQREMPGHTGFLTFASWYT